MQSLLQIFGRPLALAGLLGLGQISVAPTMAHANDSTFRLGVVTFLSGPAAGPAGIPARNGTELIIDAMNNGELPPPYSGVGIAGAKIEPFYVDENSKQKVADYKKLISKEDTDAVVGYISSGSCKAIAPISEEEQKLTIFVSCGTPQIFEEIVTDPKYVFRSTGHATSGAVAAARYMVETQSDLETISGLNQNYAWGHDSWRDFSLSVEKLRDSVKIANEQFPKIFAGQYGAEITSLLTTKSDVIHSSLWGGDLEAFVIQADSRGVFDKSRVVLTADVPIELLGSRLPNGTVMYARGAYNPFLDENPLNIWFNEEYVKRFGSEPIGASFQMAQGILALKAAGDAAGSIEGLKIAKALEGLTFLTPEGVVQMNLANGHQGMMDVAFGEYRWSSDTKKGSLANVKVYLAECVNPPEGVKSLDWIDTGFQGADCQSGN